MVLLDKVMYPKIHMYSQGILNSQNYFEKGKQSWRSHGCVHAKSLQSHLTLYDPMDYSPPGSSVQWDSPGKNTGVGCQALLQGILPTQGWNPGLLCLLPW